jgi:cytochrome c biogenesis protein CcmG/thiol:disulfide interchange protein DsbE
VPEPKPRPATIALVLAGAVALVALLFVLFVPLGSVEPAGEAGPTVGPSGGTSTGASADSIVVGGHPLLGKAAPDIDLLTIDGEPVTLSELRGRPVLVNFWATWCPPCREEFPLMVDAYAEHADDGLEILGVMHQDFADGARDFAEDMGASWPILEDPQDAAYGDYLVVGMPTSFFIDTDGIVRAFSLGGFSEDGLAAQLESILPRSSTASAS